MYLPCILKSFQRCHFLCYHKMEESLLPVHMSLFPDSTSLLNGCIPTPYITSEHDIFKINSWYWLCPYYITHTYFRMNHLWSNVLRSPTQCPRVSSKFLSKSKVCQLQLTNLTLWYTYDRIFLLFVEALQWPALKVYSNICYSLRIT